MDHNILYQSINTISLHYLNSGKNGDDGHNDAEDEVEADEDLVLGAVVRFGVIHIEEHDSGESHSVVDDGERQQSCEVNKHQGHYTNKT